MRDNSEKQRKQFLGRQKKVKKSIDKIAVKVLCRIDTA